MSLLEYYSFLFPRHSVYVSVALVAVVTAAAVLVFRLNPARRVHVLLQSCSSSLRRPSHHHRDGSEKKRCDSLYRRCHGPHAERYCSRYSNQPIAGAYQPLREKKRCDSLYRRCHGPHAERYCSRYSNQPIAGAYQPLRRRDPEFLADAHRTFRCVGRNQANRRDSSPRAHPPSPRYLDAHTRRLADTPPSPQTFPRRENVREPKTNQRQCRRESSSRVCSSAREIQVISREILATARPTSCAIWRPGCARPRRRRVPGSSVLIIFGRFTATRPGHGHGARAAPPCESVVPDREAPPRGASCAPRSARGECIRSRARWMPSPRTTQPPHAPGSSNRTARTPIRACRCGQCGWRIKSIREPRTTGEL